MEQVTSDEPSYTDGRGRALPRVEGRVDEEGVLEVVNGAWGDVVFDVWLVVLIWETYQWVFIDRSGAIRQRRYSAWLEQI